jgi:biotin carboxyl carrier protein
MAMFYAETGVLVEKDENIGEIEAMKVFYRVYSPAGGKLVWRAALGEVLAEGDWIGTIES